MQQQNQQQPLAAQMAMLQLMLNGESLNMPAWQQQAFSASLPQERHVQQQQQKQQQIKPPPAQGANPAVTGNSSSAGGGSSSTAANSSGTHSPHVQPAQPAGQDVAAAGAAAEGLAAGNGNGSAEVHAVQQLPAVGQPQHAPSPHHNTRAAVLTVPSPVPQQQFQQPALHLQHKQQQQQHLLLQQAQHAQAPGAMDSWHGGRPPVIHLSAAGPGGTAATAPPNTPVAAAAGKFTVPKLAASQFALLRQGAEGFAMPVWCAHADLHVPWLCQAALDFTYFHGNKSKANLQQPSGGSFVTLQGPC